MKSRIIEILKNADQQLVDVNAIKTPVYELGLDAKELRAYADQLVSEGVLDNYLGYMSLSERPVFMVVTTFILSDGFFEEHCRRRDGKAVQLSLL